MSSGRAVVVAALAMLAGCSALFGLHDPEHEAIDAATGDSRSASDGPGFDAPPGSYHAAAVRFDENAGDYLSQGGLAGAPTGSKVGTLSVWLHFNSGDGTQQVIIAASVGLSGGVIRNSNNRLQVILYSCTGGQVLDMQSTGAYTAASGWIHVLAAWDLATNEAQIFVNGAPDTGSATISNGAICYNAPQWYVGGNNGAALDADVADLFATFDTFIDPSSPTNRALFRSQAGKPVDLGPACTAAYNGRPPIACLIGPVSSWSVNKGTGGGFTLHGDGLAAAPTSPSD